MPLPPGETPDVVVIDETMREGMQIEDPAIPVTDKIGLLDALSRTGLKNIVVGSFVSPVWVPQMAQIDDLIAGFDPAPGVRYTALALNERGRQRRAQFAPPLSVDDELPSTLVHLCDVFVRRNTNRRQAEEIQSWAGVIEAAVASGHREARVGVNAAWGSNWAGEFSHTDRMEMLLQQVTAWEEAQVRVSEVFLGDPMGWHVPGQVEQDLVEIIRRWPGINTFHLHLHNTRGMALTSIYTALTILGRGQKLVVDASLGGTAGCPYCGNGRAAGLAPTEDLIYLLHESGIDTGVDINALVECVVLAEQVVGHALYGHVSKAGPRPRGKRLYPVGLPVIETLEQAQHFRLGAAAYADARPLTRPVHGPTPRQGRID